MQRKVFKAEFNAKVALEALAGRKTVNEMAGAHEVHPNPVTTWKREAQERLKALFERQGAGIAPTIVAIPRPCMTRSGGCKSKWSG